MSDSISDLEDLHALRDREFSNPVHKPLIEGLLRSDVNIVPATSIQDIVGQPCAFSQDAFSSLILRQRGF